MDFTALLQKINTHWNQQLPFVLYCNPNQTKVNGLLQHNADYYSAKEFVNKGFVLAPFDTDQRWFCIPEAFSEKITLEASLFYYQDSFIPTCQEFPADKEKHLRYVSQILNTIQNKTVKKVVATRKKEIPLAAFDLSKLIKRIIAQDISAFRYLWFHPSTGIWCGVSPEVLLRSDKAHFSTMALAGTQRVTQNTSPTWGPKETLEQQLVTQAITTNLKKITTALQVSSPMTQKAGSLYHIKTQISGVFDHKQTTLSQIVSALHPTPAVCGSPKDTAFAIIQNLEGYDREFYTGFLGPIDPQSNTSQLYVNLRCMKIDPQMATLYVGGGITLDSTPELEWQETKNKMTTMLSVLAPMLP
ncbi:MAG: isochorismate synthase [Patiriisocius sp.]